MIFEHIEKLKKQYTDKYVVVDDGRPELKRFRGLTGTVKTVNMSGRALVEFDGYNNIGWYDIDPLFLKVVDAPPPKPVEAKKEKAAPKAEKPAAPAPAKPAPAKPTAAPASAGGGKSVADIIAAAKSGGVAKGDKAAAPAAKAAVAPPADKPKSVADILAAARSKPGAEAPAAKAAPAKPAAEKPAPAAKVDPTKMSVADIIAAAKGKSPPAAAAPTAKAPAAKKPAPAPADVTQEPEPAAEIPEAAAPAPAPASDPGGKKSKKDVITTVAEIVAYCRKVDAK